MWFFYYFNFERSYDVLKSKSPFILLNKNTNFKNKTESKMENPTHSFRETNRVLQLIQESQIKSKTVMSWSSQNKKEFIFYIVYFVWKEIFVLSQRIVYWIHFQNIHTLTYHKTLFHTLLLLVSKIVKSLQCIIKLASFRRWTKGSREAASTGNSPTYPFF